MLDFGFYNMDCMDGMREFPDNYFDLAIVDPPYGDANQFQRTGPPQQIGGGRNRHITNGLRKGQSPPSWWNLGGEVRKKITAWDVAPGQSYFDELFRVSRNQIIWGGELFPITGDPLFSDLAQINYFRKIFYGYGGIRLDEFRFER